jgi:hypothetical protein
MCCDGRSVTAKWNEPTSEPHQCPRDVSVNIASTLDSLFTHTLSSVLSGINNLYNTLPAPSTMQSGISGTQLSHLARRPACHANTAQPRRSSRQLWAS